MNQEEKECWLKIRRALLAMIDAVEELSGVDPKTSSLRDLHKKVKCGIIQLEKSTTEDK